MHFVYSVRTTDSDLLYPYYGMLSKSLQEDVSEVHAHATDFPIADRDTDALLMQQVDASEPVCEAIVEQIQVMMDYEHHRKVARVIAKIKPPLLPIVTLSNQVLARFNA